MAEAHPGDSNPPPVLNPPEADMSKPPQFDLPHSNPSAFEAPKQPNFMPGPPVFEPLKPSNSPPPKFAMASGLPSSPPVFEPPKLSMASDPKVQFNSPAFEPPKFSMPADPKVIASPPGYMPAKLGMPVFQPPPASQVGEPPMDAHLPKPGPSFKPVFQPPPGIVFPATQPVERPNPDAPPVESALKLPSQDPPKFGNLNPPGQVPIFKPSSPVPGFSPMKPEGPISPPQAVKPGLPPQGPWIAPSKSEESKLMPKPEPNRYAFKAGPSAADPPQRQTPSALRDLGDMGKPRGLLDLVREKSCLRLEEANEWECPQCHLYNSIDFIQCEACIFENKVLAGVLTALEMPGKKREKNRLEKTVDQAKSWLGW